MQKPQFFQQNVYVDNASGCLLRFVDSRTEEFVMHYHNYYEIFLTLDDGIVHTVNGTEQALSRGTLVFIRMQDTHTFLYAPVPFRFVNLTFDAETMELLFQYLTDAFPSEQLLKASYPPAVTLSPLEQKALMRQLMQLNTVGWDDKKQLKLQMRVVLAGIFSKYFGSYRGAEEPYMPQWLAALCEQMKKPEHFTAGISAMQALAQKSPEHISRCMRKYLNMTPTAFVNDLRVNYAANRLINSRVSILDLCYECGFQNVSWFYAYFKKRYGMSPKDFRRQHGIS